MSQPVNALQAFAYKAHPVRIIERNGQPWFVLKDVCAVLGVKQPVRVAKRLDDDEKEVSQIHTLGGSQDMLVVNESGLYAVILRSDKPEAKPFRKWVTAEVLPCIRQHGFYEVPSTLRPKRSVSQPPLGKHYYTSARCTVCNTPHVHRIDQMLSGNVLKQDGKRYGYDDILLWARLKGVTLSKASLSRHRAAHLLPRLNPQGHEVTRGGLDGVLRRMVRDVVQDVLGEVLGEVQHHARRATQGRSRRTAQATQTTEPPEDD
ncbi:BRO-N domain-containing protein [Deinococcus sp. PEB2-63]